MNCTCFINIIKTNETDPIHIAFIFLFGILLIIDQTVRNPGTSLKLTRKIHS